MKYIFSFVDRDRNGIFRDLTAKRMRERIDFLPSHKVYKNKYMNMFKNMCLSYQLNRYVSLPFQDIFYNLDAYPYKENENYCLIIPTSSIAKFSISYLKEFHSRHPKVRLVALVTDSMHAESVHMNMVRNKLLSDVWELVLTYDKYDAEEFGFQWFGYTYYSSFRSIPASETCSDLFYAGYVKGGRERVITNVYRELIGKGVTCDFKLVANLNQNIIRDYEFLYTRKRYTYPEIVGMTKASNCILEVLQEGQEAQSLRYLEAIVYNKKLLSNNKHLKELPYYDSENMKYLKDVSEIDPEWFKIPCTRDYHYSGQFSPVYLLDYLDSYFCQLGT